MAGRRLIPRRIALWTAIVVLGLGAAAAGFVWSGIYSVAASRGHYPITAWFLEVAMRQSVKSHSDSMPSPSLDDPDRIRLGAAHYQGGCAPCHGALGAAHNPIVKNMLPPPSYLPQAVKNWSRHELFWIVKNGLKYTGMPAWVAQSRDDEVWSVVAFLRQLPAIDAESYRRLAAGNANQLSRSPVEVAHFGTDAPTISACARCHEDDVSPPLSRLVPKLAGQSEQYLQTALNDYAAGLRQSGIMQPVAAELDKNEVKQLSSYYANLSPQTRPPNSGAAPAEQMTRGRRIAQTGISASGVPPCLSCHSGSGRPTYPTLAGQYRSYIVGQLSLFRRGLRSKTPQGEIMTRIAQRLTAENIADAAVFFESLKPGMSALPSEALP